MMKIATREGFPLRQGAGTGLDWLSVATEPSGGGTPDLLCSPKFLGYIGIYIYIYEEEVRRWISGLSTRQGARPGAVLVHLRYSVGFFWSKNKFREVLGQLDSV